MAKRALIARLVIPSYLSDMTHVVERVFKKYLIEETLCEARF